MSYRQLSQERDLSGFVTTSVDQTGAMVVKSFKGSKTPVLCKSEADVLKYFGNPSATYPDVFEAIAFTRAAPCYISSAIHSDALYGGIDVAISGVVGFAAGRDVTTFDFAAHPTLSHVFFASSPYADDLVGKIDYISGKRFKLTLYAVGSTGNQYITDYTYSLTNEKDAFGASLYIFDVFDKNAYVIPKVNTAFTYTNYNISGVVTNFAGGTRGTAPDAADRASAWANFQMANKYPAKIMIDTTGDDTVTINSIIQTYQPYAQGVSVIPMGKDADTAKVYRQGLGIDTDDVGLYTNWAKIKDIYNNSFAWISQVGSVAKKFAMMTPSYNAASPAGLDENGMGGQLSDWQVMEVENDYADPADLKTLNEAQINPIIFDPSYGIVVQGDKTLQVTNSDTSFVGTRRLYKYMMETITKQILKKQEFKVNDAAHRLSARTLATGFIEPIQQAGWIRDFYVQCDENNNDDNILNKRWFVLDVYVKVQPNSQFILLRLTRLSQTQTMVEVIGS